MNRAILRLLLAAPVALLLAGCGQAPRREAGSLTIVTWNIHHARGLDGAVDLDRIAAELRALDADVIALQEVDRGTARTDRLDMPELLGEALGMDAYFGHNLDFQGGQYSNAILTRLRARFAENDRYTMLRENEQRGLLRVGLETEGGVPFEVWVTHLDYRPDPGERLENAREIALALGRTTAPVVLVGDFNADPGSPTAKALGVRFADAWARVHDAGETGATYPADEPTKRIDWVLFTPERKLTPTSAEVVPTQASDHRPVVVRFRAR